jgi:signal transduction histidine kinase
MLIGVWALIVAWQAVEHRRVERDARAALINRARDISGTVGVVLRSQRFFGIISRDRLESALTALIKADELTAVAILNSRGEVVASAGEPIDFELKGLVPTGEHWGPASVALMNLVDLGTNVTSEIEGNRPTIILSRDQLPQPPTNRPAGHFPPRSDDTNAPTDVASSNAPAADGPSPDHERRRGRGQGRPQFGRPFWMSEEEYKTAIEKKGVHSFVMVLSSRPMLAANRQDAWLRVVITAFASIAVLGFGVAWRNLALSSELEVRLVRASELNARLKEMNLAAAGLAHETRNPLNIIRGLAQIISRQEDASTEVRQRSRAIVDEADRVTAQLNEFINYSRPRDVRRAPVALGAVVGEVVRALGSDLGDKAIKLVVAGDLPVIEADEQLLRQVLFNLILNAVQAVGSGGEIRVHAAKNENHEITFDVSDNGPGVPENQRVEIFKPYVTNHPDGTGLGLAIVHQIVTAHGWVVRCLPNTPRGAIFRITHIRSIENAPSVQAG